MVLDLAQIYEYNHPNYNKSSHYVNVLSFQYLSYVTYLNAKVAKLFIQPTVRVAKNNHIGILKLSSIHRDVAARALSLSWGSMDILWSSSFPVRLLLVR